MEKKVKNNDIQKRIDHFEKQRRHMIQQGYTEHIGTISIVKANVMALATAGPFAIAAAAVYLLYWKSGSVQMGLKEIALFFVCFLISIPLHEGIHGLTWGLFCKNGFKSIRFGFMKESLTPYCHCMEPLSWGRYLLGGLMPFCILGIGIFLVSLFTCSTLLLILSISSMLAAGGDTTIAWMLLPYRDAKIIDHPTECGFAAFRRGRQMAKEEK